MRYITLLLTLFISFASSSTLLAQSTEPSAQERKQWFKEMRQVKNEYIAKQLQLTPEQKQKFIPLYDAMDAETARLGNETRQLEKTIYGKGSNATDIEYEKAAEALYELKGKESEIELKYFQKFKTVLTKKQLFELKRAERRFSRELMKQQHSKQQHTKQKHAKQQSAKSSEKAKKH